MRPLHLAAALLIAAMWGLNFTVIRFGLDEYTPFAFAGWRFLLGALPVLVLPKPAVSWKALAGIGFFLFTGQFVFLFLAMEAGLPPGLSSVLVQLQGPLTAVLAALFLRERATRGQWLGLGVALVGVLVIARSVEGNADVIAVGIALVSALSWAVGNLFLRETRGAPVLAVTPSRSKSDRGMVTVRVTTLNQDGEPVQVFTPKVVVMRREAVEPI